MLPLELLAKQKAIIMSVETLIKARLVKNAFTRVRRMTFAAALCFLLDMRKTTLQTRLNVYFESEGGDPISQQAFSKLRMNFDHSPFETMVREIVKKEYSGGYELPLWHGYHLFAVDGSRVQLPRVDALREEYGVSGRGQSCPCAGVSVLFDVLHGWAVDPIITTTNMDERAECEKHMGFLCEQLPDIAQNSIILLDRGYPSLDLLKKLQKSGLKFLARCSSNFDKEVKNAPMGDTSIILKNDIWVRIYKFVLPTGEVETLVTNLFDLPGEHFPALYALRWGIETAYFRLKRELCVEKFSGKTPNAIRQDFWASMVLLISVAVFQRQADQEIQQRQQNKAVKHTNRARTSDLIITLRDRFIFAVLCGRPLLGAWEMQRVIKAMARAVSPVRPGRAFPRSPKPRLNVAHNLKSLL